VTAGPSTTSSSPAAAPSSTGGYVVQPGDTLSGIAARYGVSIDDLAAANGLSPDGLLLAGASLSVSGASSTPSPSSQAESGGGAQPTAQTVSPSDVGTIAEQGGVSPSLAMAIADQESGFNNAEVSSTGATGVMQIEPGTWQDLNASIGPLQPASATDNIRGGVDLLHSLLDQTGGDPALAAAAYYQGLSSVRAHGLYSDTQAYVNNVLALQHRFGG
jgi:soluble lytic murein transglycosylase-like protein